MTEFKDIPLKLLDNNPWQVRKEINHDEGLVESIKNDPLHVRNPPMVRPWNGRYQIVSGHRRVAAARKAGMTSVWCKIEKLTDLDMQKEVLVENLHREDLTTNEQFNALEQLRKTLGLEKNFQSELHRLTGLSPSWITDLYDTYGDILPKLNISRAKSSDKSEAKLPEPTVSVIRATRGLSDSDRVKLIEKAQEKRWDSRDVSDVKKAVDQLSPEVRKVILDKKSHIPAEAIKELPTIKDADVQQQVLGRIESQSLNEEAAVRTIQRVAEGTQPQPITMKNEAREVMEDFEKTLLHIKGWGYNQYMIIGDAQWNQVENIFTQISLYLQSLKNKQFLKVMPDR